LSHSDTLDVLHLCGGKSKPKRFFSNRRSSDCLQLENFDLGRSRYSEGFRFSKVVTLSGSVEHCGSSAPLKILIQLTQLHSILARPGDATQTTLRPCWQTQPAVRGLLAPAGRPPPVLVPLA